MQMHLKYVNVPDAESVRCRVLGLVEFGAFQYSMFSSHVFFHAVEVLADPKSTACSILKCVAGEFFNTILGRVSPLVTEHFLRFDLY